MLINCPRCGFEQPKDEYCAKCGVHIPSFKAPEPGLQEKALKSASFYGFLFIILAVGSGLYFKSKYKGFDEKIDEYNISQLSELVDGDPSFERDEVETTNSVSEVVEQIEKSIQEVKENAQGPKSLKNTEKAQLDWGKYNLKVNLLEATDDIDTNETNLRQEGPNYQVFKHTDSHRLFGISNSITSSSSEIQSGNLTSNTNNSPNSDDQINIEINWQPEANRLLLEVIISYQINGETESYNSGISFSDYLKPGQMLSFKGVIPRVLAPALQTAESGLFSIYRSPSFQEEESDFYIQISIPEK